MNWSILAIKLYMGTLFKMCAYDGHSDNRLINHQIAHIAKSQFVS